ncbi:MAG: hypothetical protein LBF42_00695 [Puniceicoccales bacterium]|nr:hypothetical protein [Puniceicoccales bacterium]
MLGWSKERDEKEGADYEMAMSVYKKEDIVYVDESGIDRHLHRRNARMPDQQRRRTCGL